MDPRNLKNSFGIEKKYSRSVVTLRTSIRGLNMSLKSLGLGYACHMTVHSTTDSGAHHHR